MEDQPGASMAIAKHADLLFAQTLRVYLSQDVEDPEGWLRGISDPIVGTALAAMHALPEVQWTLQSLAKESGCSRAAFAKRFTGLMHQGALTYLTSWRMALAARYIREGQHTRTEIAGRVGYSTDAFAVAFKTLVRQFTKKLHRTGKAGYRLAVSSSEPSEIVRLQHNDRVPHRSSHRSREGVFSEAESA